MAKRNNAPVPTIRDNTPVTAVAPAVTPTSAETDIAVNTANQHPRDVKQFMSEAMDLATFDRQIADQCFYRLYRRQFDKEKNQYVQVPIEGPSVRLAEIVLSCYRNVVVDVDVLGEDDRFVYAQAVARDLERNIAVRMVTRRRITTSKGKKYSDDMIATTANAAASIAMRNSVLRIVPTAYVNPIYQRCMKLVADTDPTKSFPKAVKAFKKQGVTEQQILDYLGVESAADVTGDHIVDLRGVLTAITENQTTPEEIFDIEAEYTTEEEEEGEQEAETPAQRVMRKKREEKEEKEANEKKSKSKAGKKKDELFQKRGKKGEPKVKRPDVGPECIEAGCDNVIDDNGELKAEVRCTKRPCPREKENEQ